MTAQQMAAVVPLPRRLQKSRLQLLSAITPRLRCRRMFKCWAEGLHRLLRPCQPQSAASSAMLQTGDSMCPCT